MARGYKIDINYPSGRAECQICRKAIETGTQVTFEFFGSVHKSCLMGLIKLGPPDV
jgi:hypothetical protein